MFYTFDLLWLNGEDLRMRPLLERTAILRSIVPRQPSVMLYADEVERDGREFFGLACDRDLEGIVAKYKHGTYGEKWYKIRNAAYSQYEGRPELFREENAIAPSGPVAGQVLYPAATSALRSTGVVPGVPYAVGFSS